MHLLLIIISITILMNIENKHFRIWGNFFECYSTHIKKYCSQAEFFVEQFLISFNLLLALLISLYCFLFLAYVTLSILKLPAVFMYCNLCFNVDKFMLLNATLKLTYYTTADSFLFKLPISL